MGISEYQVGTVLPASFIKPYVGDTITRYDLLQEILEVLALAGDWPQGQFAFWRSNTVGLLDVLQGNVHQVWLTWQRGPEPFYVLVYRHDRAGE